MKRTNFVNEMKGKQRFQLALAVFLIFATLGLVSALATSVIDTVSWTLLALMTISSGGFATSIVLTLRRPWYLVIIIPIFLFVISNSERVASKISGRQEKVISEISEPMMITPEQFNDIRNKKLTVYALSSILIGFGWTMFVIVLNTEGRKRGRIESEMKIAHDIQQSLLPQQSLEKGWCSVSGMTVPTSEVGGDYFDFISLPDNRIAVTIADVSGHGVGAGLIAAMTKSALYLQVSKDPSPSQVMASLNEALAQITDRKTFVTCAYLLIDEKSQTMSFATAGHPPIQIRNAGGVVREESIKNLALGAIRGTKFGEGQSSWEKGDSVLLYTDGISESTNKSSTAFGSKGIANAFSKATGGTIEASRQIIDAASAFSGSKEFKDDATVVVVEFRAGG